MRLIIDHELFEYEVEFVEAIKSNLIGEMAVNHLVNLLEYKEALKKHKISADFCLLTNSQVKRIIDALPIGCHSEVISILKEEIPELNLP